MLEFCQFSFEEIGAGTMKLIGAGSTGASLLSKAKVLPKTEPGFTPLLRGGSRVLVGCLLFSGAGAAPGIDEQEPC
jgi:hypothetical protein